MIGSVCVDKLLFHDEEFVQLAFGSFSSRNSKATDRNVRKMSTDFNDIVKKGYVKLKRKRIAVSILI